MRLTFGRLKLRTRDFLRNKLTRLPEKSFHDGNNSLILCICQSKGLFSHLLYSVAQGASTLNAPYNSILKYI